MDKSELKKRLNKLGLNTYEATILLGFSHPNRIYSDKKISSRTVLALERLELLQQTGKLEQEKKRHKERILQIVSIVRARTLKNYHIYKQRKKIEKK